MLFMVSLIISEVQILLRKRRHAKVCRGKNEREGLRKGWCYGKRETKRSERECHH